VAVSASTTAVAAAAAVSTAMAAVATEVWGGAWEEEEEVEAEVWGGEWEEEAAASGRRLVGGCGSGASQVMGWAGRRDFGLVDPRRAGGKVLLSLERSPAMTMSWSPSRFVSASGPRMEHSGRGLRRFPRQLAAATVREPRFEQIFLRVFFSELV
jgi:hypothetical protein